MTPLHHMGEFVRTALLQIPLPAVRTLFVASLVVVLIWVIRMPSSRTTPETGAKRWDENLKIGACVALALQIVIYSWM